MGIIIKDGIQYGNQPDISGKVDKVTGKSLSTNDYTDADKAKLDGIAAGAQVNTITGVKGNAEGSYRTGNVNITPANVGAVAKLDSPSETTNGITFTEMEGVVEFREIPGDGSFIIRLHVGGQDSVSYRIYGTPDVTYIQRYDAVKGWTVYQRITNEYTDADKQKLDGIMDGVLVIDCGTVSSLPKTISNSAITANMVVVSSTIGNPAAQSGDWTVTTAAGSLTISGSISGSTTLVLYLCNGI